MRLNPIQTYMYSSGIARARVKDYQVRTDTGDHEMSRVSFFSRKQEGRVFEFVLSAAATGNPTDIFITETSRDIFITETSRATNGNLSTPAPARATDTGFNVGGDVGEAANMITRLYERTAAGDDVELLRAAFEFIEIAIAKRDFQAVDSFLEKLDPTQLPSIASIGIARATSRAKSRMPSWKDYVVRVWATLQGEQDVKHLMRGLVPGNDSTVFAAKQVVS